MDKIKIVNNYDVDININLKDISNKTIPLPSKGFCFVNEEEYSYILNTSSIFQKGIVSLDKKSETKVDETVETSNLITDEDIKKLLNLKKIATINKRLNEIDEIIVLDRILDSANEMQSSSKIIEVIQRRIEEVDNLNKKR